jgi:hypothetical protein
MVILLSTIKKILNHHTYIYYYSIGWHGMECRGRQVDNKRQSVCLQTGTGTADTHVLGIVVLCTLATDNLLDGAF